MKHAVVARNYAEALLEAARQEQAVDRFGDLVDTLAGVVASDPTIHAVLMSPRITKAAKSGLLAGALKGLAPASFIRFLGAIVRRGRQDILAEIAEAYREAADIHFNRVHATVTTARPVDEALRAAITDRVGAALGKTVLARYATDPDLLGGVLVRVGDRSFDGSVKRRLQKLRGRMLTGG